MVEVANADGRGNHPDKNHLADGVAAGSNQPGEQAHHPAGHYAAQQNHPPWMSDSFAAEPSERVHVDYIQRRTNDDSELAENSGSNQIPRKHNRPKPG